MSDTLLDSVHALIKDLQGRARNAARHNKPTMWAYYLTMAETVEDWISPWRDSEEEVETSLRDVVLFGIDYCRATTTVEDSTTLAKWHAEAVYARRLLRKHGLECPRLSLDWLRKAAAAQP